MWPFGVVLDPPLFNDCLRLLQGTKDFSIAMRADEMCAGPSPAAGGA
jgi:hypothetical protein